METAQNTCLPQANRSVRASGGYAQHIPRSAVRFTRRAVREALECGDFAVREHLAKLSQLDYVLVHCGLNGRPFISELVVDERELEAGVANLVAPIGQDETPPTRSPTPL